MKNFSFISNICKLKVILFLMLGFLGTISSFSQATFIDNFNTQSYSNNNGNQNWSTDWIETDPDGTSGPGGTNYVGIDAGRLYMHYTYVNYETIRRTANLSGYGSATLSFDWQTVGLDAGESLRIQVSNNGGSTYTQIGTFVGSNTGFFTFDISAYISSNTTIRFINTQENWESGEYFYADNVQITATLSASVNLVTTKTLASGNQYSEEGGTVTYLITVTNNGPDTATGVSLSDVLPAGLTATVANGTVSQGTYTSPNWNIGTISNGNSATLIIEGTVNAGQYGNTITNTTTAASANETDPTTAGDDLIESVIIFPDTDHDGVPDVIDLDDDNDGILDADELANCDPSDPVITNIIFSEDFGLAATNSLTTPYTNYGYQSISHPTGATTYEGSVNDGEYTIFDDISITSTWATSIWQSVGDHTTGSDNMAIFNADNTSGLEFYRRTLTNVDVNAPIDISLWAMNIDLDILANDGRPEPNITISVEQGGATIHSFTTGPIPREADGDVNAWKNFTSSFTTASSAPIEIVMINNVIGGSGNDLAIDDILISQDFCDSDADGIVSTYDLDSDNDGIYDVVEAGHEQPHTNGVLLGPVGADGIPDVVQDLGQEDSGTVNYTLLDSDSDGFDDYFEIDSDNDGCYDVVEAGFTQSVTNIGELSGTGFDLATGVVTGNIDGYTVPNDANSNSTFDYREAGSTPIVSSQPSNFVAFVGGTATFSVTASADTYQWQVSTDGGTTFTNISDGFFYSNTQSATLTINSIDLPMNGYQYQVVTSNSNYICGETLSGFADLLVRVRTVITNRRITYRISR